MRLVITDDDPRENGQTFSQRHADQHRRKDFTERARVAANGHNTAGGGNADTDGGATESQADVNITSEFCEHIFSFWFSVFSRPLYPAAKLLNY